jgi:hypothetical protein
MSAMVIILKLKIYAVTESVQVGITFAHSVHVTQFHAYETITYNYIQVFLFSRH